MSRQKTIRVDTPTPCALPENRYAFEQIIDLTTVTTGARTASMTRGERRKFVEAARACCFDCPARQQCFDVHGDDLTLGVVAGATDLERSNVFGEVS